MIHKIELLSTRTNGVKFSDEDKWRSVVGNAANYLPNLHKGDNVDIKTDEEGNVVYIAPVKKMIEQPTENQVEKTTKTVDNIETSLDGIYGILGDVSSQLKQLSTRMNRIEEKLDIENKAEFKKASD